MRNLALAAVVVLSAFLVNVPAAPAAEEWPGHMGPRRDGRSVETGLIRQWPADGLKPLWTYGGLGEGWSAVAIAGGAIYATGNQGEEQFLFRLNLDGTEKWKVPQGPRSTHRKYPGARSTPTVEGDRVYVTGGGGRVTCHEAIDGKIVWTREMKELGGKVGGWQYAESVLILGDLAIVTPGGPSAIVALEKATGKDAWRADVSATAGYSSCIPITEGGQTIIVNGSQAGLLAVDAKTGKRIWTHDFAANNTANTPTPAYADGRLVWTVGYGKGAICFEVAQIGGQWTFKEAWRNNDLAVHPGNCVVDRGLVMGKGKGGVVGVDVKTGQTKWSAKLSGGSVTMADGLLFGFSENGGKAWLAEPSFEGCKTLGQFNVAGAGMSWAFPVVVGGRLYLRYDTNLHCYDVKAK